MPMPYVYHTNELDTARYVMGHFESNPLCVIGLNPSKATLERLDVTVSKVKKFAENMHFDGWIMLNIYPQRSTNPDHIHKRRNKNLTKENCDSIYQVLKSIPQPTIWAAWGNLIDTRPYFKKCLEEIDVKIKSLEPKWIRVGDLTKQGHPRHPSRMAYKSIFHDFDMEEYLGGDRV